jgi:hypothetical protein
LLSERNFVCSKISLPGRDSIVDPLANVDLAPMRATLERKEIVLHGATTTCECFAAV